MKSARGVLCLFLAAFLFSVPATAQKPADLPQETTKRIEDIIGKMREQLNPPSVSIAIAVDNQLRYARAFGSADLENAVPAKPETLYRTASIAKSITAAAVMKLVEHDQLNLDAPIQKYCSAFPQKQWPVTARQLLGHLGGVRHYKNGEEAAGKNHYYNITDSLAVFKDEPLQYEPGTRYEYTTFGFNVLGCAIEGASGLTYENYVRDNVLKPAGMSQTVVDNFRLIIPNRARGYMRLDQNTYLQLPDAVKKLVKVGDIYNASLHDTSMKVPGGGLLSTASDLVRFGIAMNTGALLKAATVQQMWTSQRTSDGKETRYGLGWGVGQVAGNKAVSHSGGQAGTSTLLTIFPEKKVVIVTMSNLQGVSWGRLHQEIAAILLPPPSN